MVVFHLNALQLSCSKRGFFVVSVFFPEEAGSICNSYYSFGMKIFM
jgi:hypothetical protein